MIYSIQIEPVLNGWIVKVGCQTVVFTSLDDMAKEIRRYYTDPDAVEKDYIDNAVNALYSTGVASDTMVHAEAVFERLVEPSVDRPR